MSNDIPHVRAIAFGELGQNYLMRLVDDTGEEFVFTLDETYMEGLMEGAEQTIEEYDP